MDGRPIQQPASDEFGTFSPEAGQRRTGDLNQAALFRPLQNALGRLLQDRVAFRMGKNGSKTAISETSEALGKVRRDAEVAEFDQQIVGVANGVSFRLLENALQILKR